LAKGRPGKLALHIDLGYMGDVEDLVIDKTPIGQLIAAHASDLQKISLTGAPDSMTAEVIRCLGESPFLSLEEIELEAFEYIWDTSFDTLVSLSCLRNVYFHTWSGPAPQHDLTLLSLPWPQLTELHIRPTISASKWLAVLPYCIGLVNLDICPLCDVMGRSHAQRITLPNLSRLRLVADTVTNQSDIESFLGPLSLPALQNFDLQVIGHGSWNPLTSSFWESHASPLRTLDLFNLSFHEDMRSLVRTIPNVSSLSSNDLRLAGPDFDALRMEGLLPALTNLDVVVVCAPGVAPQSLSWRFAPRHAPTLPDLHELGSPIRRAGMPSRANIRWRGSWNWSVYKY
jgi:hypothetical protein